MIAETQSRDAEERNEQVEEERKLRERQHADEMKESLRQTKRLSPGDRRTIARNLGRMVESAWPGEANRGAEELFRRAYPNGWASMVKKRSRYMRFDGEPLPAGVQVRDGEYAASGRTYDVLADAFAERSPPAPGYDAKRHAILRLLEFTSLDRSQARDALDTMEMVQTLRESFERIRDTVLREANLLELYRMAARYPILPECDLAEAYEAAVSGYNSVDILKKDVERAGLDFSTINRMDKTSRRQALTGHPAVRRWLFAQDLDPRGLRINNGASLLDPAVMTSGGRLSGLHPLIPRLQIGRLYLPTVCRRLLLDLDFSKINFYDEEELFINLVEIERDAALGWSGTNGATPSTKDLRELWDLNAEDGDGPVTEHVCWFEQPLFLTIIPSGSFSNLTACLWSASIRPWDLDAEFISHLGKTPDDDRVVFHPITDTGDWHFIESGRHYHDNKYYLLQDIKEPFQSPYYDRLITANAGEGFEFLAGGSVVTLVEERRPDKIDDIKEERIRALVRLEFVDPLDKFTPLRHQTVGAAIVRNLRYASPQHRLDNLLAVEAKKYTSLLQRFHYEQRQEFDRAWHESSAQHSN